MLNPLRHCEERSPSPSLRAPEGSEAISGIASSASGLLAMTAFALIIILSGCATGRKISSKHYLPEWENKIINVPNPSETSAGFWAAKTTRKVSEAVGRTLLFPFAILGNVAVNAYLIPTWPFRWLIRGDKRLIVWYPLFHAGEEVDSDYFSKEWNRDLT